MKNAGEYWVKVEINSSWTNEVNTAINTDKAKYGWTTAQVNEVKAKRLPKFDGIAETSDSAHVESDTVRWFKFIIDPKQVSVSKPAYNLSTGAFTPPNFTNTSELYTDAPSIATRITGTADSDGTSYDKIDELPIKRGTYTAQAILVNSATDKTEYTGGNYVIKDASSMNCEIKIERTPIVLPSVAESSKPYIGGEGDGAKIKCVLNGYNATFRDIATLEKLLAQFANGESIKVYDAKGVEITDYAKVLMTGIMLRLVDGENVLNQLTISVLGDVNGDGKINTIDKAQQNSLTLGTKELGAAEKLACDINADGKVNTIDKARLNSQSLGTTDIYDGLRLPAPAARTVSETYEEVAETEIEPIVEEIAVIAVEEFATDEPETEREVPVERAEIFVLLAEPKQYIKLNF